MSPTRITPGSTTRALRPRRWSSRPTAELTNFIASRPNLDTNLAQPVCGCSVISMTADPRASRVPGRQVAVAQVHVDEQLIAGQRPAIPRLGDERHGARAHDVQLHVGWDVPSAVRELPRERQVSPTSPCTGCSSPTSSTSRAPMAGRRTIISSAPSFPGAARIRPGPLPVPLSSSDPCRVVPPAVTARPPIRAQPTMLRRPAGVKSQGGILEPLYESARSAVCLGAGEFRTGEEDHEEGSVELESTHLGARRRGGRRRRRRAKGAGAVPRPDRRQPELLRQPAEEPFKPIVKLEGNTTYEQLKKRILSADGNV